MFFIRDDDCEFSYDDVQCYQNALNDSVSLLVGNNSKEHDDLAKAALSTVVEYRICGKHNTFLGRANGLNRFCHNSNENYLYVIGKNLFAGTFADLQFVHNHEFNHLLTNLFYKVDKNNIVHTGTFRYIQDECSGYGLNEGMTELYSIMSLAISKNNISNTSLDDVIFRNVECPNCISSLGHNILVSLVKPFLIASENSFTSYDQDFKNGTTPFDKVDGVNKNDLLFCARFDDAFLEKKFNNTCRQSGRYSELISLYDKEYDMIFSGKKIDYNKLIETTDSIKSILDDFVSKKVFMNVKAGKINKETGVSIIELYMNTWNDTYNKLSQIYSPKKQKTY